MSEGELCRECGYALIDCEHEGEQPVIVWAQDVPVSIEYAELLRSHASFMAVHSKALNDAIDAEFDRIKGDE